MVLGYHFCLVSLSSGWIDTHQLENAVKCYGEERGFDRDRFVPVVILALAVLDLPVVESAIVVDFLPPTIENLHLEDISSN